MQLGQANLRVEGRGVRRSRLHVGKFAYEDGCALVVVGADPIIPSLENHRSSLARVEEWGMLEEAVFVTDQEILRDSRKITASQRERVGGVAITRREAKHVFPALDGGCSEHCRSSSVAANLYADGVDRRP